ncbi:MAG: flavin reductase family protein [Clostridiales bacterium]|nr:flavin reductase family protein [Clostridiales bacterium]
MSFITMKPGTLLSPTPVVMVSCADEGVRPNIITIAWVGTINSDPPMVSISVREERYSYNIIKNSGEFVVNLVSRELMRATDMCGVKSGQDMDKFLACGLTAVPIPALHYAPAVAQSPAYLACKVRQSIDLGSHTMFLGEIVDMGIREDLLQDGGKIDFVKADLTAYCHGEYMGLTPPEGFFGYSVARPEVLKRRLEGK